MNNELEKLLKKGISVTDISKKLNINRTTLHARIKKHNIKYSKKTGGRPDGSLDKKQRIRRKNKKIDEKKKGGYMEDTSNMEIVSNVAEYERKLNEILDS